MQMDWHVWNQVEANDTHHHLAVVLSHAQKELRVLDILHCCSPMPEEGHPGDGVA